MVIEGSRDAGERGLGSSCCSGATDDGGDVAEACRDCWTALTIPSGVAVGSTICDVWLKNRARIGRRNVGGSRVTGARSSRTERRSALLMIVVVKERARGLWCAVLVLGFMPTWREVVEINFGPADSTTEKVGPVTSVTCRSMWPVHIYGYIQKGYAANC